MTPDAPLMLVTGAPGWLGTRLVEHLTRDVPSSKIRCLVHGTQSVETLLRLAPVQCVVGDVTQPATLAAFFDGARGATVFHCAGVVHPRRAREFYEVNAGGTRHMVAAACAALVGRFVHVSSNSPFGGNRRREELFDERSPYDPYMGYGRSKMQAEQVVAQAQRDGRLETVVVRAPWFYGPGQPARQTAFFEMIRSGGIPLLGDGGNRRSMAYIDNLCQGLLLAARVPGAVGRAYWIADPRPYPFREIVDTVERVMEHDFSIAVAHRRLRLPAFVADVARVADRALQTAGLYHSKVHVLSEMNMTIACSIEAARLELGYEPAVELEEGMRRSLEWLIATGTWP